MHIKKTSIKDLVLVKTKIHKDSRGFLKEISKKNVIKKNFIFDLMSSSNKNVLRGKFYDNRIEFGSEQEGHKPKPY